jgi:hypothetical protein
MKPNAMNRLEKLEWKSGTRGRQVRCIEIVWIKPGSGPCDPRFYRDYERHLWTRESGETAEAFRERVEAEAVTKSHPKIALVAGYETIEDMLSDDEKRNIA